MEAAPTQAPAAGLPSNSIVEQLYKQGYAFTFFQAVRLLSQGKILTDRKRIPPGLEGPPRSEVVRFRSQVSLSFPASTIYEITRPTSEEPIPHMTVTFLGLTGPNGVLPRHYTHVLLRQQRESKSAEKYALRDWMDLFNHRLISLFYRAWEKYRFYIAFEQGASFRTEPDSFTQSLFSLIGMGMPSLRHRLQVWTREFTHTPQQSPDDVSDWESRRLTGIEDLALLRYAGILSSRRRTAVGLEAFLEDYLGLPVRVEQFAGQWLQLDPSNQSRVGVMDGNNELGVNLVAGERVWDVEGKIRVRLGPLHYHQFTDLLPDQTPLPERKTLFLLCQLVRFYLGTHIDFDVQLILLEQEVPEWHLDEFDPLGARLGWNTWAASQQPAHPVEDAIFSEVGGHLRGMS